MAVLNLTLSEDAVVALRDALICLHKFSDDVSLEAQKDKVCPVFVLTTGTTSPWPTHHILRLQPQRNYSTVLR